jgi:repressor LexA
MVLTRRQKELLDYLRQYIHEHGYAPTLEEIGEHFSLTSLATVHKHLSNLEAKGIIRRTWNHSRAIELVEEPRRSGAVELPLLGRVAAGAPIEELEDPDTISVPEELIRRNNTFVLRVSGDSMIDDGIWDGDYIVVEERKDADNGETVVAVIDGETTVKRFYREDGSTVRLQPANERLAPIRVSQQDLEVRGVVVAVMRKY